MFHPVIDAFLLLTVVCIGVTVLVLNWQRRTAESKPFLRRSFGDVSAAVIVILCTLAVGALSGIALAMVLDRLLGAWGLLLAAGIGVGVTIVLFTRRSQKDEA
jgi:hypothetical protein